MRRHFAATGGAAEPDSASVTFLGVERIEVLRFGPDPESLYHYVSLGCSRHPMGDPSAVAADPVHGPRAEVVVTLRAGVETPGLARTVAVLAATPAVDGVVLVADALIDLGSALWAPQPGRAPFSAVVLEPSGIPELALDPPHDPVVFLRAVPVSANEAAWMRIKGVEELRNTWARDGVDLTDPGRL
nr:suppressor of fused domain protein [Mycolicibacterium palauense]